MPKKGKGKRKPNPNKTCAVVRIPRFCPATHVIFELDVILDLTDLCMRACQRVLDEYEKELSFECRMRGSAMDPESLAEFIVFKYKLPISAEDYLVKHNAYVTELISNPDLAAGAERLIRHLHKFCIPIGVVTSMKAANMTAKLQKHAELFKLFKNIVCIDDEDVLHPKPEPYLLEVCATNFCGDPSCHRCLVFENSERGIWAANDAKMQCVMVVDEKMPCCYTETATLRIESLEEFLPEDFCLPPYDCKQFRPCACMGVGCS